MPLSELTTPSLASLALVLRLMPTGAEKLTGSPHPASKKRGARNKRIRFIRCILCHVWPGPELHRRPRSLIIGHTRLRNRAAESVWTPHPPRARASPRVPHHLGRWGTSAPLLS